MKSTFLLLTFLTVSFAIQAIKPSRIYIDSPKQYGFSFTEKKIKTPDSLRINIWDIAPQKVNKNNNVSIIFCGPDAGNMSYLLAESLRLASDGYNVVMFDYRGFGQSDNFAIDTTLLFHQEFLIDFETVLKYIRQKNKSHKVGTLGFSMGGYFPFYFVFAVMYSGTHLQASYQLQDIFFNQIASFIASLSSFKRK